MPYWEKADLEARLGAEKLRQILDDDNDGEADDAAIEMLQADSAAFVEGFLRPLYDLTLIRDVRPHQVKRLSLDHAVVQCAKRNPEYIRKDWKDLEQSLLNELELIRRNIVRLNTDTSPEPATVRR
jgi:phage gp36-like protein